eukprot:17711-Heterococcus_DN1.PRE.2
MEHQTSSMSDVAPAAKRPRSEAQKAAFERARAAREASILRKHKLLQEAVSPHEDAMEEEEVVEEKAQQQPQQQQQQQQQQPEPEPEPQQQQPAPLQPAPLQPQPHQEEEDEYDYVTFDPDEIRSQLHSTLAEVQQLRQQMEGLHGKHTELEQTFTRHNVRQANMLNFV